MSTYRPRRLDEINDVYGKSLQAKRAIRESSDMLTDDEAAVSPDSVAADAVQEDAPALTDEIPFDTDISGIASDFILRFGTPERAAATAKLQEDEAQRARARASSQSIKAKVKPVSPDTAKPAITQASAAQSDSSAEEKPAEAVQETVAPPPSIRKLSSDKTELLEDYMRVMNDEDDEGPVFRRRKKDKKRKGKKGTTEITEDSAETQVAEDTSSQQDDTADLPLSFEDEDTIVSDNAAAEDTAANEAADNAEQIPDEADSDVQDTEDVKEKEEKEEKKEKKPAKKHTGAKVLLSFLLVILMVIATAVGAVKLFLAPDTGTLVADKFYIFTSDADHSFADVAKGDLVITQKILPELNDNFVYADKNTQSFVFAKHQSTILGLDGDVLYVAESENARVTVLRDDVKGIFYKIIPNLGTVFAIVGEYYIILLSALLILCLVIILILSLAFKNKADGYTDEDGEDIEVDSDEYEDIFSTSSGEKVDIFSEIE